MTAARYIRHKRRAIYRRMLAATARCARTACIVVSIALASMVSACGGAPVTSQGLQQAQPHVLPQGWHAITPPSTEPVVSYSFSADTPGLVLACTGIMTVSASGMQFGAGHLWRTQTEGAHWQPLNTPLPLKAGCQASVIAGGHGAAVLYDGESGSAMVSRDAGDTWHIITQLLPNEIMPNRIEAMAGAIYRDGRLYTSLIFNARVSRRFSVSDDDGLTWTPLEQVPPYADDEMPRTTEQFAPDYRAPGAWFRYSLHAKNNFSLPHYVTLDHSADNGRTWSEVSRLEYSQEVLAQSGRPLISSSAYPTRLCVGLTLPVSMPGFRMPLNDLALGSSEDGGVTWRYVRVTHMDKDHLRDANPYVQMDAQGNCYASTSPFNDGQNAAHPANAEIVQWPSGAETQPRVIATLPQQNLMGFTVAAVAGQHRLHILALLQSIDPPVNRTITYGTPQLVWTDVAI